MLAMERGNASLRPSANICRLVFYLDGFLDEKMLRLAIQKSGFDEWFANVRWHRLLPFLVPRWKTLGGKKEVTIKEHPASDRYKNGVLPPDVLSRMVSPFIPPAFAFDIVHQVDSKTTLVFTWHHALMDARGAELLLCHISRQGKAAGPHEQPVFNNVPPTLWVNFIEWMKMPVRFYLARKAIHVAAKSCRSPIAFIKPLNPAAVGNMQVFRILSFDRDQTALIEDACIHSGAGFRKSVYYLAAAIRAINGIYVGRGCTPAAYVVPVPKDSRKRGSTGPIIGNQITFLFYRAEKECLASKRTLIDSLGKQMAEQIRSSTPESFFTTMELFRNLPMGVFALQAAGPTKGQIASFFFSCLGDICQGLDNFLGVPFFDVMHIPPLSVPPGISIIFTKFQERLSVVLSFPEGYLGPDEIYLFESLICSELLDA